MIQLGQRIGLSLAILAGGVAVTNECEAAPRARASRSRGDGPPRKWRTGPSRSRGRVAARKKTTTARGRRRGEPDWRTQFPLSLDQTRKVIRAAFPRKNQDASPAAIRLVTKRGGGFRAEVIRRGRRSYVEDHGLSTGYTTASFFQIATVNFAKKGRTVAVSSVNRQPEVELP